MSDDTQNLDEPSTAAALVADEVTQKPEQPEGSPSFIPVAALSRRQRADFFDALRTVDLNMSSVSEGATLADAADAFGALAAMEDAMRLVVVPGARDAYTRWAGSAPDDEIGALFAWYMAGFKPGEAKSSPS